jgi:hypothetical protein
MTLRSSETMGSVSIAFLWLAGGTVAQLGLWLRPDRSPVEAFVHWPLLWVAYFFVAVAISERLLRRLNRRR